MRLLDVQSRRVDDGEREEHSGRRHRWRIRLNTSQRSSKEQNKEEIRERMPERDESTREVTEKCACECAVNERGVDWRGIGESIVHVVVGLWDLGTCVRGYFADL